MAHGQFKRTGRNRDIDTFGQGDWFTGYCDRTGKRRYATKSQAKKDMKRAAKRGIGRHTAAYHCKWCGGYHTTSMPQAPEKR